MKGRDDGLTLEQRRERDAKALQETAARKAVQGLTGSRQPEGAGQVEASACNKVRWWRKQRSVGRGFGELLLLPLQEKGGGFVCCVSAVAIVYYCKVRLRSHNKK